MPATSTTEQPALPPTVCPTCGGRMRTESTRIKADRVLRYRICRRPECMTRTKSVERFEQYTPKDRVHAVKRALRATAAAAIVLTPALLWML